MTSISYTLLFVSSLFCLSCFAQVTNGYSVVAGSGNSFESVESITARVIKAGLDAKTIDFSTSTSTLFRSCSGFFTKQQDAIKHKTQLIGKTGIRDAWVFKVTPDIIGLFPGADSVNEETSTKNDDVKPKNPPTEDKETKKQQKEPVDIPSYENSYDNSSPGELDEVIRIYKEIIVALGKNNTEPIEKYVDPELGIIEIIDPEGIPYPIYSSNLKQAVMQGLFISSGKGDPIKDFLPEFDCNLGMWTKTGSFISKVKKYSRLTSILKEAEEVVYIDKILLNAIEKMEYRISIIILTTDESALGFFKKDGNWYLGVIDNSFACVQ